MYHKVIHDIYISILNVIPLNLFVLRKYFIDLKLYLELSTNLTY